MKSLVKVEKSFGCSPPLNYKKAIQIFPTSVLHNLKVHLAFGGDEVIMINVQKREERILKIFQNNPNKYLIIM